MLAKLAKFHPEKYIFFDVFFSNVKYDIRAFQRAAAHCLTPPITGTARERLKNYPKSIEKLQIARFIQSDLHMKPGVYKPQNFHFWEGFC